MPAVGAGVVQADGEAAFHVWGKHRRGGDSPVQLNDQWHIGSCAKSITALLFARLVEAGVVAWHTPVVSVFTDLADELHPAWRETTFDAVFYCRAGMIANPSKAALTRLWTDDRPLAVQRTDMVRLAMSEPPRQVGKFVYSNLGYMVIGAAIDRLTARTYEAALERLICNPLGITSLGYGPPPAVCGHGAKLMLPGLGLLRGTTMPPDRVQSDNPGVFSAAGTLHMNLPDWAKILRVFITAGGGLIQPATVETLLSGPARYTMLKGWARAELGDADIGMQGSNTMWAAAALLSTGRDRASLVVCNDGRTRVLMKSAALAADLI